MATDKEFTVVGVSKHKGEYKVRFANDIMRIKVLDKNGHEDIRLIDLPEPMTKLEAVLALRNVEAFHDVAALAAIDDYLSEYSAKQPKTKTGPAVKQAKKTTVPEVEDFVPVDVDEDAPW